MKLALLAFTLLALTGAACCVWLGLAEFFRVEAARVCHHCQKGGICRRS